MALWCRLWRSDVCLIRRARIQKFFTLIWNKLADMWTFDDISLFGLLQSAPHVEETQMGSKKGSEVKAIGLENVINSPKNNRETPTLDSHEDYTQHGGLWGFLNLFFFLNPLLRKTNSQPGDKENLNTRDKNKMFCS